jgi:choline-glycine betaine transporter
MSVPAIIVVALIAIGLGIELAKDGQPRTGYHNFFITLIAAGVNIGLLYWGGFFS